MKRKKHKHPEHVNMERWLVSYADFITLLFILFLILFAMSQVDNQKFVALIQSFQADKQGAGASLIFDSPGSADIQTNSADSTGMKPKSGVKPNREEATKNMANVTTNVSAKDLAKIEQQKFMELKNKLDQYIKQKGLDKDIQLRLDSRGLYLTITGTVLFENGRADLTPGAKKIIKGVFDLLTSIDNPVRIEGHTDNVPIHTAQFPSNWELSSARAVNLLRYLIEEYKMDPQRLSAAAYGEYHPVVPNDTLENRAKNRRVEISILSKAQTEADK
jgi:chemotaxis protein MotB